VILSADASQEALLRTIPVAHQYLSKPCGITELRACIDRIRSLQLLVNDSAVRRIAGELGAVPSLPEPFQELNAVINDPDSDIADVAKVVERDAGMSAKVLQLSNSAFFGPGHPVVRIQEAITFLGFNLLKSLVLAIRIFEKLERSVEGFDPQRLQRESLMVGRLASQMLEGRTDADAATWSASGGCRPNWSRRWPTTIGQPRCSRRGWTSSERSTSQKA
jgi:hypothetical protein